MLSLFFSTSVVRYNHEMAQKTTGKLTSMLNSSLTSILINQEAQNQSNIGSATIKANAP